MIVIYTLGVMQLKHFLKNGPGLMKRNALENEEKDYCKHLERIGTEI